jgi:hypothetical protein
MNIYYNCKQHYYPRVSGKMGVTIEDKALITQVNNEQPVSKSKSKYDGLLDADDGKNI